MIELINFSKHYGDLVAVNCLNLKIQPGGDVRIYRTQRGGQKHNHPLSFHVA